MNTRVLITALVSTTVVVGAVAVAQQLPGAAASHRSQATEVLGADARRDDPPTATHTTPTSAGRTASSHTAPVTRATDAVTPGALPPGPMAAPSPSTPVQLDGTTPVIDHVPTTDKVIFLGVDDGLVRDPELIALLREERIPLTLFLTREPARDGRDFFRAMEQLGSTVQAHTINHPRLPTLGWSDQHHEICDETSTITEGFGHLPTLFRPPYGEWNDTTRGIAAGCGMKAIVLWRGATNDGRLDIVGGRFHPGDVLLMHFRTDLVQNLRLVLARARAEGYRIGRIEDYLGTGPPHPMFGG